uniref:Reticulon n=1 Tax=Geotrypetes seraphini TaxID=260995 RepID=A0A6P8R226_GEOSA|nr:reticulon-4 isoform X3 [Geotrypetes seraphini]
MDAYKSQSPEISSTVPPEPRRYPREPEEEEEEEEEEDEEEEDKPRFWEQDDDGEVLDLTGGAGDHSHPPFTVHFPPQPRAAAAALLPRSEGAEKVPERSSPQPASEVPSVKPPEKSPERSPEPPSVKIPDWSPEPRVKPPVPGRISEEPAPPALPRRRGPSGSADEALFALPATSAPLYSSAEFLQERPEIYSTATFHTDAAYGSMIHPVTRAEGQASETKTDEKRAETKAHPSIAAASLSFESEIHKLDYVTSDLQASITTVATSMPDSLTPDLVQEACESEMNDGTSTKPYESKMDLVQMMTELLQEPPSSVTQLSSFEECDALSSPVLPDIVMEAPLVSGATSIENTNVQPDTTPLEETAPPLVSEEKIKLESEKPPSYEEAVKVPLSHVQKELIDVKLKMEDTKDAAFEACDLIKETKGSDIHIPPAFLESKIVTKEFFSQPESDLSHEMSSSESETDSIDTIWQPKIVSQEIKTIDVLDSNLRESPVEFPSNLLIEHENKDIVDLQSASKKTCWESFPLVEAPIAKPKTEEKPHHMEDFGKVAFSASAFSDKKEQKVDDDKDANKLTEDMGTAPVLYKIPTPTKLGLSVTGENQIVTEPETKQLSCPELPPVKTSAERSSTIHKVPEVVSFKEKLDSPVKPPGLSKEVDEVASRKATSEKERDTSLVMAASTLSALLSKASVVDLLYWRDIKKTGIVFGASLFLLLSLTVFSIVSVSAYIALALLSVTISFRIYKGVLQAVQKSDEGHPFRAYLDSSIGISEELVQKYSNVVLGHINCTVKELRRLFLVEDLVDSLKFAVLMWILTYVGALFNGLTLMILALISLFSIPVIYERHQAQIDHYLGLVNKNVKNCVAKIQAKIPGLKRKAE